MPKTSKSGQFRVEMQDGCVVPIHVPSGLPCGSFSHIEVRTLKAAIDGINNVERHMPARMMAQLAAIREGDRDAHITARDALTRLRQEMRRVFPNGAWVTAF